MIYTKLLKLCLTSSTVRNVIYHYNHNCYQVSQQPTVDEFSNIIFSQFSISVLVALILRKNNFMIAIFFDFLVFQGTVK